MTTSYTSLLGLALPVTGELSGTWGDTVNSYITQYLDSAVAGAQTISGSQTAVTLSVTNGSALTQVGSGATGSSQYQIINCTGNPASLLTITVPAASKVYLVLNSTSTSQSVKIVGAGPTTGVTVISGEKALVAWNGSDFVKVATAGGSSTFSNVTVTGTTTLSGLTASTALALDASKNVVSVTNTGTGNNVLSASPTLTGTVAGASLTLSSLTSGRVTYAGASGLLQDSANLTFDGTTLTAANITSSGTWTFSGGTANGVLYLNGSKVATSGSALTFDGTNLSLTTTGAIYRVPTAGGSLFDASGNNGIYILGSSNYIANYVAGSEQMRLTSTGLGVGTSSPGVKLDVVGTGDTSLRARTTGTVNSASVLIYNGNGTTAAGYSYLRFVNDDTNTQDWRIGTYGNNNLSIVNAKAGTTPVVLDTSGNLGIGTSSPGQKLHVVGTTLSYATQSQIWDGATGTVTTFRYNGTPVGDIGTGNQTISGGSTGDFALSSRAGNLIFGINTAEKMRLDTAGNLGLGVTPSAWYTTYGTKAFQFAASGSLYGLDVSSSDRRVGLINNGYINSSGVDTYLNAGQATRYQQSAGVHAWYTAASGTAGNAISFTQAMTLDASGNLGIGTSSPAEKLQVNGTAVLFQNPSGAFDLKLYQTGRYDGRITVNSSGMEISQRQALSLLFLTSDTERARIDSSGNLLVGTTSTALLGICTFSYNTNSTSNPTLLVRNGGGSAAFVTFSDSEAYTTIYGSITRSGTGVLYNTTSDYRLKDNQQPLTGSGAFIDALQPKTWEWKADGSRGVGFIAHEVQEVSPGSVVGEKDGEQMQAMEYGSAEFIANIIAELQSLRKRVAQLEKGN